jgi:small conductance mechanosensitive channel
MPAPTDRDRFASKESSMSVPSFAVLVSSLILTTGQLHTPDPMPQPAAPAAAPLVGPPAPPLTEAERITRLRSTIAQGQEAIQKMQAQLDDPDGEYYQAEAEFQALDKKVKAAQAAVAVLKAEGKADEAAKADEALNPLREEWKLARDRFDLAIRQRKATQETLAALKQRVEQEQKQLDRLEGKIPPKTANPTPADPPPASPPSSPAPADPPAPAAAPTLPIPGLPTIAPPAPAAAPTTPIDDAALRQARDQLEARRQALKEAEEKAQSATERVDALKHTIKAANRVLDSERASVDLIQQSLARMTSQLQTNPPADFRERQDLADRMADASKRLIEARGRIRQLSDKIVSLNEELHALEQERIEALKEAEARKIEAEEAGEELARLANPFTTRNLALWVSSHGPNLLAIIVVTAVLYLLVRQCSRHIVRVVTRAGHRGTEEDRENRANTLVGVFRYAAGVLILGGGIVMLLDEAGIPIVPLMGGAAVLGLAVAFGAQNLIKDYFSGFMMLMEDQYGVNDVVRIGTTAGLVEKITLRVTVLRDLEGIRHFIPHGSVTQVSNLTHTWSRAMFDIPVALTEDVDRAIEVLIALGKEMRADPEFGKYIIEDPEMLGVDAFDHSAVIIKFLIKTRPLKQWLVKREMLRRIKNRFSRVGITIPFPHRIVYHKFPDGLPTSASGEKPTTEPDGFDVRWAG